MSTKAPLLPTHRSSWVLRGASVPGARNLQEAGPSQDAFSTASLSHPAGEVIALLVADGAGSASRAADGATLAVSSALSSARRRILGAPPATGAAWRELIRGVAADAVGQIHAAARAFDDCTVEDLSCTLAITLLSGRWLAILTIGDTFAVIRREDRGLHLPLVPHRPTDDPSQTVFVSHPNCLSLAAIAIVEDEQIEACALSSDGLDRSALLQTKNGVEPYAPFLDPLIDLARTEDSSASLARFLLTDEQLSDTTDDDRTLVMAVRK